MIVPATTFALLDAIYKAGMRRGSDEATAHDWGSRASGSEYDNLIEALHDHINHGLAYDHPDYHDWDAIQAWVERKGDM